MHIYKLTCALASLGLMSIPCGAATTTLYHETFDGLAATNLAGTAPDVTTASAVWSGSTGFKENGTTSAGNAVYLPIAFATNTTYTFTLTFDLTAGSTASAWGALGFATTDASTTSFNSGSNDTYQTMLVRQTGGTGAYAGARTGSAYTGATLTGISAGSGMQMIITIDVGSSISSSLLSMSVVGSTGSTSSMLSNQAVNVSSLAYLAISSNTTEFKLQDLTVTASTIPEPSSVAMLAGGAGLALGLVRRRDRAWMPNDRP